MVLVLRGIEMTRQPWLNEPSRRTVVFGLGIVALLTGRVRAQPAPFTLTIARKYRSDTCTSGYFAVNGKIIAYTLERPWAGNAPIISSIPDGTYNGVLRYDHRDTWRIELQDVPGRNHIQIHVGNTPDDTEGCILIGLRLGDDLCSVIDSGMAYSALKAAFYGTADPVATPNKSITIKVVS